MTALSIGGKRLFLVLAVFLGGCAAHGYRAAPSPDALLSRSCQMALRNWQHQVTDAGAFEAITTPVPGFPYLRVDRFLASFDFRQLDLAQRDEWLAAAWSNGRRAWLLEAANLGRPGSDIAPLVHCAEAGLATLSADRQAFLAMAASVHVPDDYVTWQRAVGLYPVVMPVVRFRKNRDRFILAILRILNPMTSANCGKNLSNNFGQSFLSSPLSLLFALLLAQPRSHL